ncbi:MAG: STAS domain-containing protein [bacterium]
MEISRERVGNIEIMRIRGTVGSSDAMELKNILKEACVGGKARVIIDLENVEYISSMGVGAIISGIYAAQRGRGEMAVCGARDNIREMFRLIRLDRIADIYDDLNSALNSMRKGMTDSR